MKSAIVYCVILGVGISSLLAGPVGAADLRFDVSTSNNGVLLPNLAFPSANGHIDLLGGSTYQSTLTARGNTLGIYYNDFSQQNDSTKSFDDYPNPHDMAVAIQSYTNTYWSTGQNGWIALNEISSSNWQSDPVNVDGIDYRTWCADVVSLLKNGDSSDPSHIIPAHTGVILFAPVGIPTGNASSWQAIAQNATIGVERYMNAPTVQADGYSVATVQKYYQASYNAWVNTAGVSPDRLVLTEEFTVSTAGNGYGADGLSGDAWSEAIECRDLAIYNVGFGGFCGYAWGKNAQNASTATLISYENAYASTMTVQSEVPCWTGNDSSVTRDSWGDYLNWTGGLPSTVNAPYPLLAAANPNLPKQTAANFLSNANPSASGTTITLDGNQSITTMSFNSANPYTIAPGTGGTLTLTGTGASVTVAQGSHTIAAGLILSSSVAADLTGNLTISGMLTNDGYSLSKSGSGTLTISGPQNNPSTNGVIGISAGTLNLDTDAGSASSANLNLAAGGGAVNFGSAQHLRSLLITGGVATLNTDGQYVSAQSFTLDSGKLDLRDNDLIINYLGSSPASAIRADLIMGYAAGEWSGNGGIVTSSAAPERSTTLGYAEASDVLGLSGLATGTFDGQTVNATTLLVKYTWVGDANLDGVVNAADLARMSPTSTTWSTGDFNYDGLVNADDYALFQLGAAESAGQNISATLPEPAVAMSGAALMGLLFLRRRR